MRIREGREPEAQEDGRRTHRCNRQRFEWLSSESVKAARSSRGSNKMSRITNTRSAADEDKCRLNSLKLEIQFAEVVKPTVPFVQA